MEMTSVVPDPAEVTHVPRIHPFSPVGMVAVTYAASLPKHFATRLTTDGEFFTGTEATSRTDLTASPSTSWDSTDPARPTAAELWEKLFLADGTVDYADRNTFLSLDATGTVLEPHFAFDGGSSQALRPYCLEEFNNVLFLAGYGDETVGDRPEMIRHSFLGKSPDAADGFDAAAWIMIGAKGQRVTAMCKGDTAMLVAKTNELYRISGYGRAYAGWQYEVEHIQQSLGLGCYGPYALCFAQGYWYGVGQNGPFRTDGVDVQALRGPREHAWALVSSPEAFSVDYHPDRGLVLFSVRQATGLPEGLYLSDGVVTPPQATYPNVLWAWDLNRDVWSSDLGFNQQFFHVRAIPTITTQSPQGTPTALAGTDMLVDGYTGNWTNGDPTAETEFYERAGVAGSFALAGTAGDGDTSLVRTGLNQHTRYYYYLQHLKGGIRSTASATIEVLTLIAPPVLDVIAGSASDPTSPTQLLITAVESGMTLTIEESPDGIGSWTTFVTSPNFPAGTTSLNIGGGAYYRAYLTDSTWTPTDSDYSNIIFAPVPS